MIIDGNKLQEEILDELKQERRGFGKLALAAVLVGENKEGETFLKAKEKVAKELNVEFRLYRFEETISREKLRDSLNQIVRAKTNTGVILQLPLPEKFNAQYFLNAIVPEKDVDMLSSRSLGDFYSHSTSSGNAGKEEILPPSVATAKFIFEKNNIEVKGKMTVVFGFGKLVGQPISFWLVKHGATVTVIDMYEKNPERFSKEADIIISGVGIKNLVTAEMIKRGAVVIDFGGDVNQRVADKALLFTPTPGGTGPILVAMIFKNLLTLAQKHRV